MGPARRRRPGPLLDAAAGLPDVHHAVLASPGSSRPRARTATGRAGSSTRTSATPTPSRCSPPRPGHRRRPLPGLPRRVPGPHRRFMAGPRPVPRLRRPAAAVGLSGRAARAELLRRHLPAALAVRAAGGPGGARAVRPPPLGRRDDRAVPVAVRARVHQLGPVRGRAGHPRHVGVGPPPAGPRRGPPRAGRRGEALSGAAARRALPAVPAGRAAGRLAADGGRRGGGVAGR